MMRRIPMLLLLSVMIAFTIFGCASPPGTLVIEISATPAMIIVTETSTQTSALTPTTTMVPKGFLQRITSDNADRLIELRRFQIPGFEQGVLGQCSLAFTPDSTRIAAGCNSTTIPLRDISSGLLHQQFGRSNLWKSVAIHPDGDRSPPTGFQSGFGDVQYSEEVLTHRIGSDLLEKVPE